MNTGIHLRICCIYKYLRPDTCKAVKNKKQSIATMPGSKVPKKIFKNSDSFDRYSCSKCNLLLKDPVQLGCGHRICRSCADELIANESTSKCPDCKDDIDDEDGAKVNYTYCDKESKHGSLLTIAQCFSRTTNHHLH